MADAALAGLLGLDAWGHLQARTPGERITRNALLREALKHRADLAQDLAIRIANAMNGEA